METTSQNPHQAIIDDTFQKIEEVEQLMLNNDPQLYGHLQAIHNALIRYDDIVHLLSDDQINKLIAGQIRVTGTVLVKDTAKSTKASITRQARGISVDDL